MGGWTCMSYITSVVEGNERRHKDTLTNREFERGYTKEMVAGTDPRTNMFKLTQVELY